jgi:hypothetical protein
LSDRRRDGSGTLPPVTRVSGLLAWALSRSRPTGVAAQRGGHAAFRTKRHPGGSEPGLARNDATVCDDRPIDGSHPGARREQVN